MFDMRRRGVIRLLGGAAAWPVAAHAQQPANIRLIGFLGTDTASNSAPWVEGLRAGLREFGYFEGREVAFEFRFANGQYERLARLAAELVGRKIDVLVTHGPLGCAPPKTRQQLSPL